MSFRGGTDESAFTQPGVKLRITDEQTGFEEVINLPTGPDRVVLREPSELHLHDRIDTSALVVRLHPPVIGQISHHPH